MKIDFNPEKMKIKSFGSYMVNKPVDVEMNNISRHAVSMSYQLEAINLENQEIQEILFTESNHHHATVSIFSTNHLSCSCEQYCSKECSFCKHIAVLDFLFRKGKHFDDENVALFSKALNKSIQRIRPSSINTYVYYDSFDCVDVRIGSGPNLIKTPSIITKENYHRKNNELNTQLVNLDEKIQLTDLISLYDYQRDNLFKMLNAKRAICSMVMGAGKTLTSVAGIKFLETDNALIVCPKSVAKQWEKEINRVLNKNVMFLNGKNVNKFINMAIDVIGVCSYQTLSRNIEILAKKNYKLVIADEIQFVRNDESKTWSAFRKIKSDYFWGLSGTVIENRLDDLYNIMDIIDPNYLGAKWKFDSKFKKIKSIHATKVLYENEVVNIQDLKKLISKRVFSYDKLDLEEPVHIKHFVEMSKESRIQHDAYIEEANKLIAKSLYTPLTFADKAKLNAFLLRARQCCNTLELIDGTPYNSQKVNEVVGTINQLAVIEKKKVVLYSEWTSMLDIVAKSLKNISFVRFDGSMSMKQRGNAVNEFVENDDCMLFMSSDAGSVGLDSLQLVSHNMIHVELPWNPAKIDQRIGRLRRINQKDKVNVHYFITKDSIESKIHSLLDLKRKVRKDSLFTEVENTEENLDPKDLLQV